LTVVMLARWTLKYEWQSTSFVKQSANKTQLLKLRDSQPHCQEVPFRLTIAPPMLDIETEWTPSKLLPKLRALSASSRCRTLVRFAKRLRRMGCVRPQS
jgi:hypothetical protein